MGSEGMNSISRLTAVRRVQTAFRQYETVCVEAPRAFSRQREAIIETYEPADRLVEWAANSVKPC